MTFADRIKEITNLAGCATFAEHICSSERVLKSVDKEVALFEVDANESAGFVVPVAQKIKFKTNSCSNG